MQANDVRVLKSAALPTLAGGVVALLVAFLLGGGKAAFGAGIALALVAAFFTVSLVAVAWAGRVSPMAMMTAAVLSYLVKALALMMLLRSFEGATAFDPRAFGWTVIALTVVWTFGEMRGFMKLKMLYVDPEGRVPGQGS
ncbi:hypothetical protein [Sinosporangium siamense]|uniref:ATP synthase protein I n=1 Tax=Sinosporangium siamense TaxID=1367973 RepID=A0A919RC78_9ACTN|nr:hypothetical protein [Sinosporangium siamense]GII91266.1 hypothetical protein Ssi02_14970 [Sinosporangium siamense]